MKPYGMRAIVLQYLLEGSAKFQSRPGEKEAEPSPSRAVGGYDVVCVVGGKIQRVVKIGFAGSDREAAAQHSSQGGAAADGNRERSYLQRPDPIGRQPFPIYAEWGDKATSGHGDKTIGNVIKLGIGQAIGRTTL